jgi:hypothetical protein
MTVLTAQQIVTMATQAAKCPGYTSIAGQWLNMILEELALTYDFDLIKRTYNFSFNSGGHSGSGPYPLPSDWYRGIDKDIFYTIDGVPYPMVNVELLEYDNLVQTAGLNSYPYYYATDMSQTPPTMLVWPPASGAYPVTARYYSQSVVITTPESSSTVPWFPVSTYLVTRLAGELMKITNDDRVMAFLGNKDESRDTEGSATSILRAYLKMKDDRGGKVNKVQLDRRNFGTNFDRLPNTKTVGW